MGGTRDLSSSEPCDLIAPCNTGRQTAVGLSLRTPSSGEGGNFRVGTTVGLLVAAGIAGDCYHILPCIPRPALRSSALPSSFLKGSSSLARPHLDHSGNRAGSRQTRARCACEEPQLLDRGNPAASSHQRIAPAQPGARPRPLARVGRSGQWSVCRTLSGRTQMHRAARGARDHSRSRRAHAACAT